ncbi:MAG: TIGR04282 family arsenosugar biosynthesis glycosyltransferase [Pseudomonadota bacterium]|jgi:rSAM/selenodomain-associated transferase 1
MIRSAPRARTIQVFARAPVEGAVKTRLIPALGPAGAARLHARMVEHTLDAARGAARELAAELQLWATGEDTGGWLATQAQRRGATLRAQPDGDLGERMQAATSAALADGARVVLVGSDCPARTPQEFVEAFAALEEGHDLVLQPACDGGYTLIGLVRAAPALLTGMAWGGPMVFAETCARARAEGLRLACLPATWDVDRPEDLQRLAALGPPWAAAMREAPDGR